MKIQKGNLTEKFDQFDDHWHPRVIAGLNGQEVKIAKVQGEFPWHSHEHEDEMFFVIEGELKVAFRDRTEILRKGDFLVVPKGVEHQPSAEKETQIMMFEPGSTVNTGDVENEYTVKNLDRI